MKFAEVIKHVEEISGIKRSDFATAKREEIRIFAYAKNVNDECIIDRFCGAQPTNQNLNGDKTKQHIKDKLSLDTEDTAWLKGRTVSEYKIIGIRQRFTSNTVKVPPPEVQNALKEDRCRLLDTSANCEIDHRYPYHLYEDDDFYKNPENYSQLHRVCQGVDRERKKRMKQTGLKYDNRKMGCYFHTVCGTSKYEENEATTNQPSLGIWWEDPKKINLRDKTLFIEYQKRLTDYAADKIISLVNEITANDVRIENIEEVVIKIKGEENV